MNKKNPDKNWASKWCPATLSFHCCTLELNHEGPHECDCCDHVVTWVDGQTIWDCPWCGQDPEDCYCEDGEDEE